MHPSLELLLLNYLPMNAAVCPSQLRLIGFT